MTAKVCAVRVSDFRICDTAQIASSCPERPAIDKALDWRCLASSVRLLASLEQRDHLARLHMRRNKQCAL